jgi:hypothetical protein
MTLGTVRVPRPVTTDGQALNAGTYQVRLAGEALKPAVGETPNHEQWGRVSPRSKKVTTWAFTTRRM